MTDEIDLDAFSFGEEMQIGEPKQVGPDPAVAAAIEAEVALHQHPEQMTITGEAERVGEAEERAARLHLSAMVYESRSGGAPHVVTFHEVTERDEAGAYHDALGALCTCKASRNLGRRPQGCWAMQDAREVRGLPPVPPSARGT